MADLHSTVVEHPFSAGKPVPVSPLVTRITAPNPSPMTGPGTNTYLVGREEITVVDPGPAIDSHIEAILAAGAGRIRRIAVTHTHPDHSPAAQPLARATGAKLVGAVLPDDGHQDRSFHPDQPLSHGQQLAQREYHLEAIHTPGHVGNHYCFWLAEDQMLFTGDHIMQGATVVIIPPSGDMADYIQSLQILLHYETALLAPAHGHIMSEAHTVVQQIIDHRLRRERRVVEALQQKPDVSLDQLMDVVYSDVDSRLWRIAKLSLWAHLLKLEKEGRAVKHAEEHWLYGDELWRYVGDQASHSY